MKRDIQKLQRAIVDGLEDVKAQEVQVFDVEHLSPLFERVVVASGTSSRQIKALAASVRDAVRAAGFPKPRTEGEENSEWIIVDCGSAVVHIMQPTIRQYYRLEELWGEKPVRLKFGAARPKVVPRTSSVEPQQKEAKSTSTTKRASATRTVTAQTKPSVPRKKSSTLSVVAKKVAVKAVAKHVSDAVTSGSNAVRATTAPKPKVQTTEAKAAAKKTTATKKKVAAVVTTTAKKNTRAQSKVS